MSKILSGLFLLVVLAGPAMAQVAPAPAPEVDGGILGLMFAAGIVYLINRRSRSRS